ncbi:elongation factor Ts (EF-Ts) [Mycoplasmopsis californica HAZ160_1]|uniref:Elongation factor Ts n=2 Tax=Mycoplasmopsis californica TaxID=2113 RepID=A0AAT9F847_9BACT|nr:translation elongation factor Ts [Mycoplasmopsis californica]BAP01094.1 elongation factor Ts (EF-Ts) [Mycoplasmopsis californica HAZ160_1]BBG40960.1 elongation factor Ts [Mycoplasmopsis californica]BBG41554.1 elongation factor Ts [Mycoplasmopsis californica]BBG42147.1 elongation factor Ts [Mycoplasmopsis californica]BBG42729.1 elongation factor Ts [Mycoplasmopsis californica]
MANQLALIKEVRERTGGGMIDVKKALEASEWDVEKAIIWLKSNGKIKAAKKAGRVSAEGLVAVASKDNKAIMLEVNSETDFVAKNEDFRKLVERFSSILLNSQAQTVEEFLAVKEGSETVESILEDATATIGEKLSIRRFERIQASEGETIGAFAHVNGQIAALVKVKGSNEEVARNVAMHTAAMKPEFIFVEEVPAERIETFKAEFVKPANFDSKPANIQENIINGSLNKKLADIVLVKQGFMMEESVSIEKYLSQHNLELIKAVRYGVGEGIEKRQDDFAAEVEAQMAKAKQ